MPVSSYVIRCLPEDQPAVREQLHRIPGIEIGEGTDMGIPVATEAESSKAAEAIGNQLQNLAGVKSAVLVYHNFEDVADV
jgi:nitrate reductase NapAB chaperone NapD